MKERKSYSRFVQNICQWHQMEKGKIIQLLHHCIARDITTFDTADFHGAPCIEKSFGIALSESGLSRDEIQFISKYEETGDSHNIVDAVDDILLRLRTDYLDLLLIQSPAPSEELIHGIERLFSQGKLLEIGAMHDQYHGLASSGISLSSFQTRLDFSPESLQGLDSEELASGKLTCLGWLDFDKAPTFGEPDVLDQFNQKYKLSRIELLTAWILQHPVHLHPVILFTEKEEISSATAIKEVDLDPLDWQKINLILT